MLAVIFHNSLIFLLVAGYLTVAGDDVVSSSAHLRMLEAGERDLIASVKTYVDQQKSRIEFLEGLIAEVEAERTSMTESDKTTSVNPVEAINLVQRFSTTWNNDIIPAVLDSTATEEVKSIFESLGDIIPSESDYDSAKSALIRLQQTYEIPVQDLINGQVLGQSTKPMSQLTAVEVALYALYRKLTEDALAWLTHAQNHTVPPLVPLAEIYHDFGRIYAQRGDFLQSALYITKALELDPTNQRYMSEVMPDLSQDTVQWRVQDVAQQRLCREYMTESVIHHRPNVDYTCSCERDWRMPFRCKKVEALNRSPDIVIFHDFISDSEAERLTELTKNTIRRAAVGLRTNPLIIEDRIAKTAWLHDDYGEPVVDRISRRIYDYTGLETRYPASEALQVGNYGLGGHYSSHYDYFGTQESIPEEERAKELRANGDRIATLMLYLDDVEAGGATVFPDLDIGTRPIKNAAVFWYNYKRSGVPEPKSMHAGCPVLIGEKWVANKWIRSLDQMFRRRCDLTDDT